MKTSDEEDKGARKEAERHEVMLSAKRWTEMTAVSKCVEGCPSEDGETLLSYCKGQGVETTATQV